MKLFIFRTSAKFKICRNPNKSKYYLWNSCIWIRISIFRIWRLKLLRDLVMFILWYGFIYLFLSFAFISFCSGHFRWQITCEESHFLKIYNGGVQNKVMHQNNINLVSLGLSNYCVFTIISSFFIKALINFSLFQFSAVQKSQLSLLELTFIKK